jgi:ABC-type multidrug transport system fused ATPase/permease subunit
MIAYFKTIWKPLRWVKFPFLKFGIGLFIESSMFPLMQICVGLLEKYLVNAVEYKDVKYMTYVYAIAVSIIIMVLVFNPIGNYLKERSMHIYTQNLRECAIEKLLKYQYCCFEKFQTGELTTRLRDNLDNISKIYTESIFRLLMGILYGVGSIIIMLIFSWQLSLVVVFLCLCETWIMAKVSLKITEENQLLQKITDVQYQILYEIIKGLSFIKISAIKDVIAQKYERTSEESSREVLAINKENVFLNMLEDVFEAINLIFVFSCGIILYFLNKIDLGSIMSFLFLQDGISYMISNLREFYAGIAYQIVSCQRVQELFEQKDERMTDVKARKKIYGAEISIRNLSFRYNDEQDEILKDINLRIPQNKITVVYGPSGSGKSTLIKLLLALYVPLKGEIFIGESNYEELGLMAIRDYYAYIGQSPYLFHDTIEANIRCDNTEMEFDEIIEASKLAGAHEFIMKKPDGYKTMVLEHGSNFSGGEKQRIVIARAILKKSNVIILDEATSGIDAENEAYIYNTIKKMIDKGKTIILISHRASALQIADCEIEIKEGRIVRTIYNERVGNV